MTVVTLRRRCVRVDPHHGTDFRHREYQRVAAAAYFLQLVGIAPGRHPPHHGRAIGPTPGTPSPHRGRAALVVRHRLFGADARGRQRAGRGGGCRRLIINFGNVPAAPSC
jgi:hypothetical protein